MEHIRDVGRGTWDVECLPGSGMLIYKMPWFRAGSYVLNLIDC